MKPITVNEVHKILTGNLAGERRLLQPALAIGLAYSFPIAAEAQSNFLTEYQNQYAPIAQRLVSLLNERFVFETQKVLEQANHLYQQRAGLIHGIGDYSTIRFLAAGEPLIELESEDPKKDLAKICTAGQAIANLLKPEATNLTTNIEDCGCGC